MTEAVLFYLFSFLAVIAGLSVVIQRSPIASALSLVVCFFALAADYVMLDAHFVAVVQVLVYAGAIMVLFIFVIMLLNIREPGPTPLGLISGRGLLGIGVAALLGVGLIAGLDGLVHTPAPHLPDGYGTIHNIGEQLFGDRYLLPFEAVSLLLTVGMIGAVVLAKREV
ncbi:MAG: NADH-quinone oxidoreductase subunit J [Myxococcales bacterium]|nr:NADH-quinone oxidoreductase subunit J [Myxococcales bacterium]